MQKQHREPARGRPFMSVYLPGDYQDWLHSEAAERGASVASIIREGIDKLIDEKGRRRRGEILGSD